VDDEQHNILDVSLVAQKTRRRREHKNDGDFDVDVPCARGALKKEGGTGAIVKSVDWRSDPLLIVVAVVANVGGATVEQVGSDVGSVGQLVSGDLLLLKTDDGGGDRSSLEHDY